MQFLSYLSILAAGAPFALSIAYSVTAYGGEQCNFVVPTEPSLTVSGYGLSSQLGNSSCFQLPFQAESISIVGCAENGVVSLFTDERCGSSAKPATINARGILCQKSTPVMSFAVNGC